MTDRLPEDQYEPEKRKAINSLEDAIRRQTEIYAHGDSQHALDRHEQMFLQAWVGISSWAGVDSEGIPTSKLVVHLNDYELPAWQIIGLLRAALIESEQAYTSRPRDEDD